MDNELIERLAEEAGFEVIREPCMENRLFNGDGWLTEELRRFAALVADECAKLCDAAGAKEAAKFDYAAACAAQGLAEAIRAKFKEPK